MGSFEKSSGMTNLINCGLKGLQTAAQEALRTMGGSRETFETIIATVTRETAARGNLELAAVPAGSRLSRKDSFQVQRGTQGGKALTTVHRLQAGISRALSHPSPWRHACVVAAPPPFCR